MAERQSTSSAQTPRPRGSVQSSNPNIFSDEFALDPLELIDSHQTNSADCDGSHDVVSLSLVLQTPRTSLSFQQTLESPSGSFRRSRGSQRSDGRSSISSRVDDHGSQTSRPPRSLASVSDTGTRTSTPHPSIRSISTFGFPRAQSPYQGATGPSHPYGMYPQDIGVMRTPSVTTTRATSTTRQPDRPYHGPNGPTQPYGMYSQNTVPEDEQEAVAGMPPPIAAGFPGLGQNYQRRLGPDGEDVDDIIGPDGYAEQLPPYSRYANGVPPKYSSGVGSLRRSPAPPTPAEDSQETLNNPDRSLHMRDEAGPVNPFADSATELESTTVVEAAPKEERGSFKDQVREKTMKRVCCGVLPCWLLGIMLVAIVLAVFLGGIIGGLLAHKRGQEKGRQAAAATVTVPAAATVPTTIINISNAPDAEPLASTPSNLPPIPTGSYGVVLENASTISNSCLTNVTEASAWDCATWAELNIDITLTNNQQVPLVSLWYPSSSPPLTTPVIRYGSQPPQLNGPAPLTLMENKDNSNEGPAYTFVQLYNKTVILKEDDLPGGYVIKRSLSERLFLGSEGVEEHTNLQERDNSPWTRSLTAQPSDKPWYCFWNGTVLEGFIFITQTADPGANNSTAPSSASQSGAAYSSPPLNMDEPPGTGVKRQAPSNLPSFPKVIKIEERRRMYNAVQPYCQQMQILNTGLPGPLKNEAGQPIIVNLTEIEPLQYEAQEVAAGPGEPPMQAYPTSGLGKKRSQLKRAPVPSCQCQWMSGL